MAIVDMKRGDAYIVRAYRGEDLIFERGEPYIASIGDHLSGSGSYIYIDDLELMSGYTYEIDFIAPNSYPTQSQNEHTCIIGGSYNKETYSSSYNYQGMFLGFPMSSWSTDGLGIRYNDYYTAHSEWRPSVQVPYTVGIRQTVSISYTNPNVQTLTDGGFYLFAARAYDLDDEWYPADGTLGYNKHVFRLSGINGVPSYGKYFRITIKDANNNILKNFLPKVVGGHKGMIDTVSNSFYQAANDDMFEIGLA